MRLAIALTVFILTAASPASAQKAHSHNLFHYGSSTTDPDDNFGTQRTQKNAYCNSNGQDVGALFLYVYPNGSGAFQIVGGGSGGWEDKDWTRREYETAQQAKAAGEKYAAKVFNRACSAR